MGRATVTAKVTATVTGTAEAVTPAGAGLMTGRKAARGLMTTGAPGMTRAATDETRTFDDLGLAQNNARTLASTARAGGTPPLLTATPTHLAEMGAGVTAEATSLIDKIEWPHPGVTAMVMAAASQGRQRT